MFLINAKRVLKAGFVNFWRNSWVSLATISVVVMTLFTFGAIMFSRAILGSIFAQIQDKVDISVYFKTDASEDDIFFIKNSVSGLAEVKSVEYVSSEEALENFRERHKDNALITQSLEELGDNPLGAVLNIKAEDPSQYAAIAKFLESDSRALVSSAVDKINYYQNQKIIDRLSKIIDSGKTLGASLTIILAIISILVTFNTIRLAIFNSREEIGVMRLVGASNRFVSGPFIVSGIIYGIISAAITMILFYPFTMWLGPMTANFFSGVNLFEYYVTNFFQLFLVLCFIGVALGALSSLIAVRRYLKV